MPLLETRGITVRFGGTTAVDAVDLTLDAGHVTGLIGPNGAGKTTLFNVVTGMQRPSAGSVLLDGDDITGRSPGKRGRLGIARTFQRLELFLSLSVRDNVRVAGDIVKASRRGSYDVEAETERVLELTGLGAIAAARGRRHPDRTRPGRRGGTRPDDPPATAAARRARIGPDRAGDRGLRRDAPRARRRRAWASAWSSTTCPWSCRCAGRSTSSTRAA